MMWSIPRTPRNTPAGALRPGGAQSRFFAGEHDFLTGAGFAKDVADDEDVAIVKEIYRRDAVNLNTSLAGPWLSSRPVREIIHALDRL